jgi:hypothetical protein
VQAKYHVALDSASMAAPIVAARAFASPQALANFS